MKKVAKVYYEISRDEIENGKPVSDEELRDALMETIYESLMDNSLYSLIELRIEEEEE